MKVRNAIDCSAEKGGVPSLSPSGPIAPGGSFTPDFVRTEGFDGITVLVNGLPTTATGTLFLEFSIDGITADRTITIPVLDPSTANPRTLEVIARYFRVRYVNDLVVQTSFAIEVIFHATKSELTARLNQSLQGDEDVTNTRGAIVVQGPDGIYRNLRGTNSADMGVAIFDPQTGIPTLVTPAGALKISEIVHLVGDAFSEGPISPVKWSLNEVNGATQNETGGELILDTNGGANADVSVTTFARARFYPGHFNTAHVAAQLSDVWQSPDTIAEWGAYDAGNPLTGNGIFVRYTAGEFNIVTRRNGVEIVVNESAFTGFIPSKNNLTTVYEIGFNAGTARFFQGPFLFHVQGAAAGPYIGTPHLKAGARLYNINGSAEQHDLRFRALGIYRVGRPFAVPDFRFIDTSGTTIIKETPGTLHRLILSRIGGGASSESITLYDSQTAGGLVISEIPMVGNGVQAITFEHTFSNGLVLVSSSAQLSTTIIYD